MENIGNLFKICQSLGYSQWLMYHDENKIIVTKTKILHFKTDIFLRH